LLAFFLSNSWKEKGGKRERIPPPPHREENTEREKDENRRDLVFLVGRGRGDQISLLTPW